MGDPQTISGRQWRQRLFYYGVAIASSLLALAFTVKLSPYLDQARMSLFFGAVFLSAWRGGTGPGIVATLLTTALADLWVLPEHAMWALIPDMHVPLVIYFGISLLTVSLLGSVRRSTAHLQESERKFRAVFEKSDDAMLISRHGRHVLMNPAYLRLFGYEREDQLRDRPVLDVIAEKERAIVQARIEERSRGLAVPNQYETLGVRIDGTVFDMAVDVTAIEVDSVQYSLVAVRDITRQKHAEQEARSLKLELERQVAQRTAQLENANQELEAFSYSVSHDLRAPLRAIDGYIKILMEDHAVSLDVEGLQLFEIIRTNAVKMDQLIKDLLTFSRLSRREPEQQWVDMQELAEAVARELARQENQREVKITVHNLPTARGDASLLRQVLVNLVSNAVKFTRDVPEPRIDVIGRVEGQELHYLVRDNGVGFDMQYAGKLFKVFQRLHRVEEFEGTGVGLAIVQRIVRRHGGRVWAEAAPQQGACFHFVLPGNSHAALAPAPESLTPCTGTVFAAQ